MKDIMRKAIVLVHDQRAGLLIEETPGTAYTFEYDEGYDGAPISLTMPTSTRRYKFDRFPAFFDGLLPEGFRLNALLRRYNLDPKDYFSQLLVVGGNTVGAVTVEPDL